MKTPSYQYKPEDYSDVSQSKVLTSFYCPGRLAWASGTKWLYYTGIVWKEDSEKVQEMAQLLACSQCEEAEKAVRDASEAFDDADIETTKHPEDTLAAERKREAKDALAEAKKYLTYSVHEKQSARIGACMDQAVPMVKIEMDDLDSDPFILNCPGGTYDLRAGEMRTHRATDYCTHVTKYDPGPDGREEWQEFIDKVTCGNNDLAVYLQELFGRACIGRVYTEDLTIFYGGGGNGKSTLTNAVKEVLGDYAVQSSPRLLIAEERGPSKDQQMGVFRGARLALMSELEFGQTLDAATLKRLVSTDEIYVNPKYKTPYSFRPTHTTVLSTNYRPMVSNQDQGTWDRISVVPFNARFRGEAGEVKNYGEGLAARCGPYIMQWLVEGAAYYIENNFTMVRPEAVEAETEAYRAANDWLTVFISCCCETGDNYSCKSSELYSVYKDYCDEMNIPAESTKSFKAALEAHGYKYVHTGRVRCFTGLRPVKAPVDRDDDPAGLETIDIM